MIPEEVQRKWGLQQMTTELTQRTHTADPSAVLDITHYSNLQAVISLKQRSIRGLDCLTAFMGNSGEEMI